MRTRITLNLLTVLAVMILSTACNFPSEPTVQQPGPATLAARTVEAILTQASSGTQAPVFTTNTPAPTQPPIGPSPTSEETACVDQAAFIADATIPDNTTIPAGNSFLKIWTLENAGSCTWTTAYKLTFFGGELMGASPEIGLQTSVLPGGSVDLAIDLIAPTSPGTYQGFWRLRNTEGDYFGIGPSGDQSFWVKIIVPAPPTATSTATLTLTPSTTPTASATGQPTETQTATATDTSTPIITSTTQ
jgi:hypothetical protein